MLRLARESSLYGGAGLVVRGGKPCGCPAERAGRCPRISKGKKLRSFIYMANLCFYLECMFIWSALGVSYVFGCCNRETQNNSGLAQKFISLSHQGLGSQFRAGGATSQSAETQVLSTSFLCVLHTYLPFQEQNGYSCLCHYICIPARGKV